MSKVIDKRELRVIDMSRSGNHAMLHWLLSQTDGRHCLLNCAESRDIPGTAKRVRQSEAGIGQFVTLPLCHQQIFHAAPDAGILTAFLPSTGSNVTSPRAR